MQLFALLSCFTLIWLWQQNKVTIECDAQWLDMDQWFLLYVCQLKGSAKESTQAPKLTCDLVT